MRFRVLELTTVDSTNTVACELAREGAREGLVVTAEHQTKGRGRYKRRWVSPRGKNLLCSILVRPHVPVGRAPLLTRVTGEAVVRTLKQVMHANGKTQTSLPIQLKRPNDVLCNQQKICGILTEASSTAHTVDFVVIGVGLNINARKSQLVHGATSIASEIGHVVDKATVFNAFLVEFASSYHQLTQGGGEALT